MHSSTLPRIPGVLLAQPRSVCSETDRSQAWHPLAVPHLRMHWHSEYERYLGCPEVSPVERLLPSPFAPSDALWLVYLALSKVRGASNALSLTLPREPLV